MKDKPWLKWVGIGCGVLSLLGCMASVSCLACSMMARNMAETAAHPGGDACVRAVACCQAATAALGSAEAGDCSELTGQVGMFCDTSLAIYAGTFEQHGLPVPPVCESVGTGADDLFGSE